MLRDLLNVWVKQPKILKRKKRGNYFEILFLSFIKKTLILNNY
jgi:hypothetical protein